MTDSEKELLLFLAERWIEEHRESGWYTYASGLISEVEKEKTE